MSDLILRIISFAASGRRVQVCLDDFAGSASFQYLSALDVDIVKLDEGGNAEKSRRAALSSRRSRLCRRLGVETVGEIDSLQTLAFVRDCNVDYVQGFLFGKPSLDLRDFDPLPHRELMSW